MGAVPYKYFFVQEFDIGITIFSLMTLRTFSAEGGYQIF